MEHSCGSDAYLNEVLAHVRWKKAHGSIRKELGDHIEDARLGFLAQGMKDGEAQEKAVLEMGDAEDVGARFDKAYRPAKNYGVWVPFALLMLAGFFLRSYTVGDVELSAFTFFLPAVFIGMCFFRFEWLIKFAWPLFGAYLLTAVTALFIPDLRGMVRFVFYLPILFPALYALLIYRMRGRRLAGILLLGAVFMAQMLCLLDSIPFKAAVLALVCLTGLFYAVFSGWFSCKKYAAVLMILVPTVLFIFLMIAHYYYGFHTRFDALFPALDLGYGSHYFDELASEILGKIPWFGATGAPVFSENAQIALFQRPGAIL
ncbi:MAG TPA: permease prefix domain 1-containing protein [Clostridia bacterium]|nr:permease prefix domain 1-containing protein [Clostridia bacterium]